MELWIALSAIILMLGLAGDKMGEWVGRRPGFGQVRAHGGLA